MLHMRTFSYIIEKDYNCEKMIFMRTFTHAIEIRTLHSWDRCFTREHLDHKSQSITIMGENASYENICGAQ